eukprot:1081105-Pleurochrysis_carterae.AAC.1
MAEASVDKIFELPIEMTNLPLRTLDQVILAGHRVHEDVRSERDGVLFVEYSRMRTWLSLGSTRRSSSFVRVVAVAIANITCENAQDDGADNFDGQSDA